MLVLVPMHGTFWSALIPAAARARAGLGALGFAASGRGL